MIVSDFIWKVCNRWKKIRLQPIRVFCLHHVCATYDAVSMNKGDWMQIDEFKSKVLAMRKDGVKFTSLTEAYNKIANDIFRNNKYVVFTFDDGYASLKEILPWLNEQRIPVTLFINGKYLDGESYRKNPKEQYLTKNELFALTSPLIEVGSHGWEHTDASVMTEYEFTEYIDKNIQILSSHPRYIPYHAYTWGKHSTATDEILHNQKIVPIYMDGIKNYSNQQLIHREIL